MSISMTPAASAANGQLTVGNNLNVQAGGFSASKGGIISVGAHGFTTEKTKAVAIGDHLSSGQSHAVSIGSEGVRSDFSNEVRVGDTELSVGENIECCGAQLCSYSIECCGSECGVSSGCLADTIMCVARGCWSGISCLIDQLTSEESN